MDDPERVQRKNGSAFLLIFFPLGDLEKFSKHLFRVLAQCIVVHLVRDELLDAWHFSRGFLSEIEVNVHIINAAARTKGY